MANIKDLKTEGIITKGAVENIAQFEMPKIMVDTMELESETKGIASIMGSVKVIESDEDYIFIADCLKRVKGIFKKADDQLSTITKPLNLLKKNIANLFKPNLTKLEELESHSKKMMYDWDRKKELERQKKEREIQLQKEKELKELNDKLKKEKDPEKKKELESQIQMTENISAVVPSESLKVEGIQKRKRWVFEIIKESAIPREYLIPNEKLLQEIASTRHDTMKIEGISFKEIEYIASSAE